MSFVTVGYRYPNQDSFESGQGHWLIITPPQTNWRCHRQRGHTVACHTTMVTCLASSGLVLSVSLLLDSVFTSRFTENGHLKVSAGTSVFLSYGSVFAVVSLLTDSTTCDKAVQPLGRPQRVPPAKSQTIQPPWSFQNCQQVFLVLQVSSVLRIILRMVATGSPLALEQTRPSWDECPAPAF